MKKWHKKVIVGICSFFIMFWPGLLLMITLIFYPGNMKDPIMANIIPHYTILPSFIMGIVLLFIGLNKIDE